VEDANAVWNSFRKRLATLFVLCEMVGIDVGLLAQPEGLARLEEGNIGEY
jgi:hypothetical protein